VLIDVYYVYITSECTEHETVDRRSRVADARLDAIRQLARF
jgi:hypothetical protein